MSDYRFELVEYNDIPCLHVMIDGNPMMAETHIPLDDIQAAMTKSYTQMVIESLTKAFRAKSSDLGELRESP